MRPTRRRTWALIGSSAAVAALVVPAGIYAAGPGGAATGARAPRGPVPAPSGAECRTTVEGSLVIAYCHNPYPSLDHVRLHTECARWWDVDGDGTAVAVLPGRTVRLQDRCWKDVATAWVSHG
ncbi:hypothetical protein OG233_25035 [Streptomyces sp. NBC_01218]|uniref:hypothetical protein n=1 Tax=unclassified Streptomyces TaxID=2593676 RepID=UPI0023B89CAE|nr:MULTISPECIES: hypothetical protein [unclassified Streptomyces]WEH42529.1 hypothetical protein PZB77_25195 [Streptomyces sp. AM 2-1-1]WSQ54152.1 hypothetical protein OG233_25035 [Streptomyces sp. NBC_01218]